MEARACGVNVRGRRAAEPRHACGAEQGQGPGKGAQLQLLRRVVGQGMG